MATGYGSSQMDPSAGGGGSNWERDMNNPNKQDISTAEPRYNAETGQWEFQLPSGAPITGRGDGFEDKGFLRDAVNNVGEQVSPGSAPGSGGGGGGLPYGKMAGRLAPILGKAAGSRANAQQANDLQLLANRRYELDAPAKRLSTSVQANRVANLKPLQTQWGGPGSGMRPGGGYTATGGYGNMTRSADLTSLAEKTMHDQLMASLNGDDKMPAPGKSSALDKILGYGAMATSIYGGL